jgi:ketosteroid isomerase-like protein
MTRARTQLIQAIIVVFVAGFLAVQAAERADQKEAERYIVESERQWAESVATGETAHVERILADDFLGVSPDGKLYDKATMIAETREAPKVFVSNHLNEVKVRFFGDTAVAQGNESWVRRTGEPRRGRFVWTDTWIRRGGKWQIVAAEDLIVAEATTP